MLSDVKVRGIIGLKRLEDDRLKRGEKDHWCQQSRCLCLCSESTLSGLGMTFVPSEHVQVSGETCFACYNLEMKKENASGI